MVVDCLVKIKHKQIELPKHLLLKNILFTQGNVPKNSGWGRNKNMHFEKVLKDGLTCSLCSNLHIHRQGDHWLPSIHGILLKFMLCMSGIQKTKTLLLQSENACHYLH